MTKLRNRLIIMLYIYISISLPERLVILRTNQSTKVFAKMIANIANFD